MLIVDDRVGSKDLAKKIRGAELGRLEYGDVAFLGNIKGHPVNIGIELKTVSDILACMRDGRFAGHQLPGMMREYNYIYLVIEGGYRANVEGLLEVVKGKGRWGVHSHGGATMWRDLENFITTLEAKTNLRVRKTYNRRETVALVKALHSWWVNKEWGKHRSHLAFDRSGTPAMPVPPSLLRRVAKELPGVGWGKSQAVEQHFKTIEDMVGAKEEEWRKIEGIGKILSEKIVKGFH
jgi:ERCC4-type nuclease